MTEARTTPTFDDHGDRFPGAIPVPAPAAHISEVEDRLVRMQTAYLNKVNSVMEAGRENLAIELAQTFAEETAAVRTGTATRHRARCEPGRRTPSQDMSNRRPAQAITRLGRLTRRSLERFDQYTLDVFNAGSPYGSRDGR